MQIYTDCVRLKPIGGIMQIMTSICSYIMTVLYLKRCDAFLRNINVGYLILIAVVAKLGLMMICMRLERWGLPNHHIYSIDSNDTKTPLMFSILLIAVLIPLLETLIFQKILYWLLNKVQYVQKRHYYLIIISALIFSLYHIYSLHYMLYSFITGAIYMYLYKIRIDKQPFATIFAIHSAINLFAVLGDRYFPHLA